MKRIIGVCACPAGIAHTYMAAENLERQGKKLGFQVKIETNGSGGVENRLREEDIKEADYVIIAADTRVEMERFRGNRGFGNTEGGCAGLLSDWLCGNRSSGEIRASGYRDDLCKLGQGFGDSAA